MMTFYSTHRSLPVTAHGQLLLSYLRLQTVTVTVCIKSFNNQNCYFLFIQCIYVFYMNLRTNSVTIFIQGESWEVHILKIK